MTFCQNRDLISKNDLTLAPHLHKFVCDAILQDQGRVRGAKIAWSGNVENDNFWRVMLAEATCLKFLRPCRGPLAARERPLMVGIWLVETVYLLRRCLKAILFSPRRSIAEMASLG